MSLYLPPSVSPAFIFSGIIAPLYALRQQKLGRLSPFPKLYHAVVKQVTHRHLLDGAGGRPGKKRGALGSKAVHRLSQLGRTSSSGREEPARKGRGDARELRRGMIQDDGGTYENVQ